MLIFCVMTQATILPEQLMTATTELVRARGAASNLAREKADLESALKVAKVGVSSNN